MIIEITNRLNGRKIIFASKDDYIKLSDRSTYTCNQNRAILEQNLYVIRNNPTGFFDNLQNNPQTIKGSNQDGSNFTSDYSTERILTWEFNNLMVSNGTKDSWSWFSSVVKSKNTLLDIKVLFFNSYLNTYVESKAKCYNTNNTSFEAGEIQVTLDGNGSWRRGTTLYTLEPYIDSTLPHFYYENGSNLGATYVSDNRKAPFATTPKGITRSIVIPDVEGITPIIIHMSSNTLSNVRITNSRTTVFSEVSGTYKDITIDSIDRTVVADGNNKLSKLKGNFINLVEGDNELVFTGNFKEDMFIEIEVVEYANSIS